jgi:hypothetical protein
LSRLEHIGNKRGSGHMDIVKDLSGLVVLIAIVTTMSMLV